MFLHDTPLYRTKNNTMTFENIASLGLGLVAINIKTPLDSLHTTIPIESLFTSQDLHEISISLIKLVLACVIPYGINKLFRNKKTPTK